ncbi:DoxX family membrane protein [Alkalicoccus urumqiensis]|nr:DoxX family membrane protein [Alkalicoccus urumqiensis]
MKWLLFFVIWLVPAGAFAHVKWFTDESPEKAAIDDIMDTPFFITAFIAALAVGSLPKLISIMRPLPWLERSEEYMEGWRNYTFRILQYGTAAAFIIQQFQGGLFAPELMELNGLLSAVVWVMIALFLIPNRWFVRAGALLLTALYGLSVWEYGWLHMLDYVFYLGIAYVFFVYYTRAVLWKVPVLYVLTGFSLCWVAAEKWVFPVMSRDVIIDHNIFTFGFPPDTFAMLTGFVEFTVGYLLIVGLLSRFLGLILTLIFLSTTILFGWLELIGHFPIHIILLTFILEGTSFYRLPVSLHDTVKGKMASVMIHFLFALAVVLLLYYRAA